MKIGLAQMAVVPGQPEVNLVKCLDFQKRAFDEGAQMVLFPELCLSGYLIGDLWEEESFVRDCVEMGHELTAASTAGITCFGNVGLEPGKQGEDGRPRRYNSAWVSVGGRLQRHPLFDLPFFPKTLLPNYREFEETRHFYDMRRLAWERGLTLEETVQPVKVSLPSGEVALGLHLCEDGWSEDYDLNVPRLLVEKGAALLINLSASPFTLGKELKRHRLFSHQARTLRTPLVYVNCIGMQNNAKTLFSFDGNAAVYDAAGQALFQAAGYDETLAIVDLNRPGPRLQPCEGEESAKIHGCLKNAVGTYMRRFGLGKVVIGVSGGIDSAVSAAFFTDLLGPENVLLVNMPSVYNTATTRGLAASLMDELHAWRAFVPIDESVKLTEKQLVGLIIERESDRRTLGLTSFHLENVQARDRSSRILAALAAAFGGVFPSNANKAETMVGYATLYGDHAGFVAPLADLWKHQVYALGDYLNREVFKREAIPRGIFDILPTAELSPEQNPEAGGGDPLSYAYHDRLFESWMQRWHRSSPEEILECYADGSLTTQLGLDRPIDTLFKGPIPFIEDLERWWCLFKGLGVVKRLQAPPVVAVCRRAFGFDYRESILTPYFTRAYLARKASLLKE